MRELIARLNDLDQRLVILERADRLAPTFGSIYVAECSTAVTISGTGVANKAQVISWSTPGTGSEANGQSLRTTPDISNDHITIDHDGIYYLTCSFTAESTAGGVITVGFELWKNNGATHLEECHQHRQLAGGGGDEGMGPLTGYASLDATDTVEFWIYNATNTSNVLMSDINLAVSRVA